MNSKTGVAVTKSHGGLMERPTNLLLGKDIFRRENWDNVLLMTLLMPGIVPFFAQRERGILVSMGVLFSRESQGIPMEQRHLIIEPRCVCSARKTIKGQMFKSSTPVSAVTIPAHAISFWETVRFEGQALPPPIISLPLWGIRKTASP
jgi:hypothetical protein